MDKVNSNLQKVLESGTFAVTAELGPPRNADAAVVREKAKILKGFADAVNITDNQTAIVRMAGVAAAVMLMEQDIEPVVQMTCRDRNRLAMQSDILGMAALGVKNILCLTGDHQKFGDNPEAKGVWDLDAVSLTRMVKDMRDEKKMASGVEMEVPPQLFIGVAENPFADPFELRARRLAKKIEAGAQFVQTQIIYNVEKFERWMEEVRALGLDKKAYVLAGISPLKSAGMAKYMKNNVPGMDVPDAYIERMTKAKEEGRSPKEEGIKIAVELIEKMKKIPGVAGAHVMAIEWEEAVPDIIKGTGLHPRP